MQLRIDDVTQNTDLVELRKMIMLAKERYECTVIGCVSVFSKQNFEGAVYPAPPFKGMPTEAFYHVNQVLQDVPKGLQLDVVASHGLLHVDHTRISPDAQQMSILTSCYFLSTNVFMPPFGAYDSATEMICDTNNLKLIRSADEGWKSLEHNVFDSRHDKWYFHPWRYDYESFKTALEGRTKQDGQKLGLVQGHPLRRP